jgi:hypothetical protein
MGQNILAHSQNKFLQKYFQQWGIAGELKFEPQADNFLHFDFVSIGANKSEKFVRTKIWHDSTVQQDGTVKNTLEITRTHELHPNEIQDLLRTNLWSENVRALLTDDILWKLGSGESRMMLRVYVPPEARLLTRSNPSGAIESRQPEGTPYQIFEIPMNVVPGETVKVQIKYETKISRGTGNWRPYYLYVRGTPGREKTSFLETVSTQENGTFSAETNNLGRPQDLISQDYRAVVEFARP